MKAITIKNLNKWYGSDQILKSINFDVEEGEFFGFLGPNGAGKTTTINSITGLSTFQSGEIQVFGNDVVTEYRSARRLIGLSQQEFNFDTFL
jgi:ABC-2 type transport system ATP-binding protein